MKNATEGVRSLLQDCSSDEDDDERLSNDEEFDRGCNQLERIKSDYGILKSQCGVFGQKKKSVGEALEEVMSPDDESSSNGPL